MLRENAIEYILITLQELPKKDVLRSLRDCDGTIESIARVATQHHLFSDELVRRVAGLWSWWRENPASAERLTWAHRTRVQAHYDEAYANRASRWRGSNHGIQPHESESKRAFLKRCEQVYDDWQKATGATNDVGGRPPKSPVALEDVKRFVLHQVDGLSAAALQELEDDGKSDPPSVSGINKGMQAVSNLSGIQLRQLASKKLHAVLA